MVRSLNGDIGSSVIPISGDDWMFLGRGRHVWLDDGNVHFSGSSGPTLSAGIETSGEGKIETTVNTTNSNITRMQTTANRSALIVLEQIDDTDNYRFCCGGWQV